jgi:hypothetical protein
MSDPVMPLAVWWFFIRLDKNGDLPRWIRRKVEKGLPVGPQSLYLPSPVEARSRARPRMNPATLLLMANAFDSILPGRRGL